MEDKNRWNGYEKHSFHILNLSNVQMQHNMHFSNHLDAATVPPLPPPNNVGMKKHFQDGVKCTGVQKLQDWLGRGGKWEKLRQIVLIVLRILSSIVARFSVVASQTWEATPMKIKCLPLNSFKKEYKPFLLDSQAS